MAAPSRPARPLPLLGRRLSGSTKRLFIGGESSVRRTLAVRALLVLVLHLIVMVMFWFDRDGLRDHHDGEVSLADVVYFSMVTVTTVGYGDIVPVTERARIIDAVLVTPIRLFIWLIFLGTAYQLVLQRLIEDLRMRMLQSKLAEHVIICGYGHFGRCAAAELHARGMDKKRVVIVDISQQRLEEAAEDGYIGLWSDATHEDALQRAMVHSARAVLVCTGRDDTNVLIVLTARHLSSGVRIVARVEEGENEKLLRQSGANATVLPSRVGGILMADSIDSSAVPSSVMDLISAGGRMTLIEREATANDVGRTPEQIDGAILVRVLREGREYAFWEPGAQVRPGDKLVLIQPVQRDTREGKSVARPD